MPHTWHAVDLLSGKRGPELRMQIRGQVSRIIGEPTDAQASVLCWDQERGKAVPDWRQWTEPGRMMAVLVDDADVPVWGGVILRRVPDHTIWVPITMATLEHYLDRRYTYGTYLTTEQATIAQNLISSSVSSNGIPFTFRTTATGQIRDRTYLNSEDKTILSLITDLLNLQNGIEFTVDLEWSDTSHTVLNRVITIASRLGRSLAQPVRFEHPGPVQTFNVVEDYTRDNGANDVIAVSSGEGDARPSSQHAVDQDKLDAGWARYERRWTPSTSISEQATLDNYALSELARVRNGATEISLVANLDTCPRLNADWWLGDDLQAVFTSPAYPERVSSSYEKLPGFEQRVRVVGWAIDLDARTLTPSLRPYAESYTGAKLGGGVVVLPPTWGGHG